jgi:DNA polymerase
VTSLHLDYESRSAVDLKKTGAYVYAEDESTDVWCAAYAIDNEPVKLWHPDLDDRDIKHAIKHTETVHAWNAAFERAMTAGVLVPRYGWPAPRAESWRCVMVQALAMALPGKLEQCAPALHLDVVKDKEGHSLMLRMSKPRKPRKGEPTDKLLWWDDEERRQRLYAYCKTDVVVERKIEQHLLPLRTSEQALWHLDQVINDRGIYVDTSLCRSALAVVSDVARWLNEELAEITDGDVTKITAVDQLVSWLAAQGVSTESLDKAHVADLLGCDLPRDVRRVLEIRAEGGGAAVKKIDALVSGASRDSRARGLLQFHVASTGRWGGRRFQPQNIRRPKNKKAVPAYIEAVATGSADFVALVHGDPLSVVSDVLRGLVGAAPGCALYAADFSNIEGRLIAWFADEQWKLQAFRDFDAGVGHDIYKLAYARSFSVEPESVGDDQRQIGKVMELALGYQGGVGAFQKMAVGYGVIVEDARADELKVAWREAHPNVVQWWYDLEQAAKDAIANPGTTYHAGRIAFRKAGSFLYMRLPSGRAICYPYPCMKRKLMPWTTQGKMILPATDDAPAVYEQLPVWKDSICYKGVDQFTRQWTDQFAHGGLLANNAVQGTARDVEAEAIVRVENAGYPVVLSVHDEVVSETSEDFGSLDEFKQLMATLPEWAEGLPLAVSGFKARRYQK